MTTFTTNEDIVFVRANILNYFPGDAAAVLDDFHKKATEYVIRDIGSGWYRGAAALQGFNSDGTEFNIDLVLDTSQLKDLACYKCLYLVYRYLANDFIEDDGFTSNMKHFANEYNKELHRVVESGINYDWDGSGVVEEDERGGAAHAPGSLVAAVEW